MLGQPGTVTLIGSGEFGDTMARVYRSLLARLETPVQATFLDTPAGFEVNVDDISAKAVAYFQRRHDLHWIQGLDLLGSYSLNVVVVPHWINAEGAGFDTRFCFMGEARWTSLERLLPSDAVLVAIDEHTAVTLDLHAGDCEVAGIGGVTIRHGGRECIHPSGSHFPLDLLRSRS